MFNYVPNFVNTFYTFKQLTDSIGFQECHSIELLMSTMRETWLLIIIDE